MNVDTDHDDPDPEVFDCSELVEWAAAQVGVDVGEASYIQYLDMKGAERAGRVEDAINTPGALLFKFPTEPVPGGGRPSRAHVAISLGDGRMIEAMSTRDGVGVFNAGDRFGYAALIPGMDYAGAGIATLTPCRRRPRRHRLRHRPTRPARHRRDEPDAVDTDHDMLPDHFEIKYGLLPEPAGHRRRRDHRRLRADRARHPGHLADSDFDGITDGLELVLGLDPLVADNPDPNAALVIPDDLHIDTDGDGITDWGEEMAGTDPTTPTPTTTSCSTATRS